jgi:hypothetical protein
MLGERGRKGRVVDVERQPDQLPVGRGPECAWSASNKAESAAGS